MINIGATTCRNLISEFKELVEVDLQLILETADRKRAEDAIWKNEKFLDAIFNSIQDGISVLDPELNIMRANKAMQDWYPHMLPLEGKKSYETYHGRTEACVICPTLQALESGRLEMNEVPLTQAEGETGTLEVFAFPMLDTYYRNFASIPDSTSTIYRFPKSHRNTLYNIKGLLKIDI